MKKSDIIYYVGYLALLILFGVWMLAWAVDTVRFREAFMLWMLSAGIMLIIIGAIGAGTKSASNAQLGAGLGLSAFTLILLGLSSNIMGGLVGAAVGIILIGIIGLVLLLRKIKTEA